MEELTASRNARKQNFARRISTPPARTTTEPKIRSEMATLASLISDTESENAHVDVALADTILPVQANAMDASNPAQSSDAVSQKSRSRSRNRKSRAHKRSRKSRHKYHRRRYKRKRSYSRDSSQPTSRRSTRSRKYSRSPTGSRRSSRSSRSNRSRRSSKHSRSSSHSGSASCHYNRQDDIPKIVAAVIAAMATKPVVKTTQRIQGDVPDIKFVSPKPHLLRKLPTAKLTY